MPSTTPSSGIQTSTIVLATLGTVTTAALAYAVYFDYKRRSDPAFRRSLKRQQKQVSKAAKDEAVAAEKGQKEKIRSVVDSANDEGFPTDPEKTEEYFMTEVARGEQMCQDGSDPVDAALCFYKALKVYPQPRELINIYDKTVPKVQPPLKCSPTHYSCTDISQPILDILAEMIAVDSSIKVSAAPESEPVE
ncbi:unnamed protein product [Aureobasidium mustum]|uniref:Mitochondrial import receptor subunit TOM20 n=1 Tax=Aureobasidium mustum TaxID=2773714 RepID=A0A9N8JM13_9PEZI|nr:unnamed protein product [Aureobasidium mustum]